jgi:hypothetical protein
MTQTPPAPEDFPWPSPRDDAETQALARLQSDDAVIASTEEAGKRPASSCTAGLFLRYGHPELLLIGLPPEVAEDVLGEVIELVAGGARFAHGEASSDVLRGFDVRFVAVPADVEGDWLQLPRWLYSAADRPFPCLQVVWPARNGRFPGQKGSPTWMPRRQPVLGDLSVFDGARKPVGAAKQ